MIAVIADQVKAFRHQLGKHVFFVGSRAVLQPYEITVQEMLENMALEWAGDRVAALPPDQRPAAALAAFAEAYPEGRDRTALLAARLADLRPGEGNVQLARLIKDGYVPLLFTMSPDDALERALAGQRLTAGEDYHCVVAGADAPSAIDVVVRESSRVVVVKCGGDISRKVLPLTEDEIRAVLAPISDMLRTVLRRMIVFTAYGERDRPFLEHVPRDGDRVYWVNLHIPVAERSALDDMRLESPDAEQYHKLQPEVLDLLRSRNSERNLLCREPGRFSEFFGRLYERLRRRTRHERVLVRRGLTVRRGGPFKFLEAFDTHDADVFFGREGEVARLYDLVARHPLVTLFGRLAVGKTSLLRAGLIPKLQQISRNIETEDELPWLPVYVSFGHHSGSEILQALAAQVEEVGYDPTSVAKAPDLLEAVRRCHELTNHRPVLLCDAAQELFLKLSRAAREELVCQIAAVVQDDFSHARVVLTLREDYLGELYEITDTLPKVFHNMLRLHKFTRQQAEDAIVKPVANFGLQFDSELVEHMLEDLDREGILPVHLQIVCHRLLEEAGPTRRYIGPTLYARLGGARKILDEYITHPITLLAGGDRRVAWQILRTLAEASETLAALPTEEVLATVSCPRTQFDRVLARLEDMRLVRTYYRGATRQVEIIHDFLAQGIRAALAKGQLLTVQSAHDILIRGLDNFNLTGELLDRGEMHRVNDERDSLTLSAQELELAIRSAVHEDIDPDYWLGRLGELRDRKYVVLSDMLESNDKRIRGLALKHARDHIGVPLIKPLTTLAQGDGVEAAQASDLLKTMRTELLAGLTSADTSQRIWAAKALGHIGGKHLRELVQALDDKHQAATAAIADTLARLDARRASRLLLASLVTSTPSWAVAEALGRLGQDPAILTLIQRATARAPASPYFAYALGLSLMRQRRYEEAMEVLETSLRLAETQGLHAPAVAQALDRCRHALLRSQRGEDRWPMAGGSVAHTHFIPTAVVPPLKEFWTAEFEGEVAGHVVAARGIVFCAQRTGVATALDVASGAEVWKRSLGAKVEVSPTLWRDLMVVATVDSRVIALSLSGEQRFVVNAPSAPRAPLTATDDMLFLGDRSGAFVTFHLESQEWAIRYKFDEEITGAISYAQGLAFAACWDATVIAFDLQENAVRWRWHGDSPIAGAVAVAEDVAVWTCDQGAVVCASPGDGKILWQVRVPAGSRSAAAITPNHVLVSCLDGAVRALSRTTGEQIWEFRTADQVLCAPLVTGDVVYIGSRDGCLYAVSLAEGEPLWRYATSYGIYVTPAVVEGMLMAPLRQRQVVAFAPEEEVE